MNKEEKELKEGNHQKEDKLEDESEKQWEMQDQIHKTCKMKGDPEERQKKWKEKYS